MNQVCVSFELRSSGYCLANASHVIKGEKKNVVDVDIPFEKPINCEMTVETDKDNPENIAKNIIQELKL